MKGDTSSNQTEDSANNNIESKLEPQVYWRRFLSIYLLIVVLLLALAFTFTWDHRFNTNEFEKSSFELMKLDSVSINGVKTPVPDSVTVLPNNKLAHTVNEGVLIFLIAILGAFGAILHAMVSLGVFVGNNAFEKEWNIWYIFRPVVGGLLALLVYFVLRAGFVNGIQGSSDIYTMLGIASLVGMFSRQAQEKLGDIFNILFQSKKPEEYRGKLVQDNPVPKLESVTPEAIEIGTDDAPITITGSGFIRSSVVRINNQPVATEFSKKTELKAIVSDLDLYKTESLRVRVFNGAPGGGLSEPVIIKLVKPTQPGKETSG